MSLASHEGLQNGPHIDECMRGGLALISIYKYIKMYTKYTTIIKITKYTKIIKYDLWNLYK